MTSATCALIISFYALVSVMCKGRHGVKCEQYALASLVVKMCIFPLQVPFLFCACVHWDHHCGYSYWIDLDGRAEPQRNPGQSGLKNRIYTDSCAHHPAFHC